MLLKLALLRQDSFSFLQTLSHRLKTRHRRSRDILPQTILSNFQIQATDELPIVRFDAQFLSHLAKTDKSISFLRRQYPNYYISKNKIELTPDVDVDAILVAMENKYKNNPINTIDGVKIEFDKEWVHLRKSNTEPIIRIYSESETMATAEHLANKIISDIRELITAKNE